MGRTKDQLEKFLFPKAKVCLVCQSELRAGDDHYHSICTKCKLELPLIDGQRCKYCKCAINYGTVCSNCSLVLPAFDKYFVKYVYRGSVKSIVIKYKDLGGTYLYEYIAKELIDLIQSCDISADFITYVPCMHATIKQRGFEHNNKVATLVGSYLAIPTYRILERIAKSSDSTVFNRAERLSAIKNNFRLVDENIAKDKTVIIIDDVVTTAATINECSRLLKHSGGAKEIIVISFARA